MNTKIYSLSDPRNGRIRYIGKSDNPQYRLTQHLTPQFLKFKTHKNSWIKELLSLDMKPVLEIVDTIPEKEWQFWEKHYISLYRSWGFNLTNGTDGGDGGKTCLGKSVSEDTKRKISVANKGKRRSVEARKKMRLAKLGKPGTRLGTHVSEETKEKLRVAGHRNKNFQGKHHSEESREKMRKASLGRIPWNKGARGLQVAWNKGLKTSTETNK